MAPSSHCFALLHSSAPCNWSVPKNTFVTTCNATCCIRPWLNSRPCDRIVPIVMPPGSFIEAKLMARSAIAVLHVAKHSISYTKPPSLGCTTNTSGLTMLIASAWAFR